MRSADAGVGSTPTLSTLYRSGSSAEDGNGVHPTYRGGMSCNQRRRNDPAICTAGRQNNGVSRGAIGRRAKQDGWCAFRAAQRLVPNGTTGESPATVESCMAMQVRFLPGPLFNQVPFWPAGSREAKSRIPALWSRGVNDNALPVASEVQRCVAGLAIDLTKSASVPVQVGPGPLFKRTKPASPAPSLDLSINYR